MFSELTLQTSYCCVSVSGFHYETYLSVSCGLCDEGLLQMVTAFYVK